MARMFEASGPRSIDRAGRSITINIRFLFLYLRPVNRLFIESFRDTIDKPVWIICTGRFADIDSSFGQLDHIGLMIRTTCFLKPVVFLRVMKIKGILLKIEVIRKDFEQVN